MDELDRIPWMNLRHAYGSAEDVPELLRALQSAPPDLRGEESPLWQLFGNIYHQGTVYEATSYAVPYLIKLAADPQTPDRVGILNLLAAIAEGSSYLAAHEKFLASMSLIGRRSKFETAKARELEWVAKAHAAVEEGFEAYVAMTREESGVRFAAAHVLSRFPSRVDVVGPLLRRLFECETRSRYRASLLLLLGDVQDRSPEALAILTAAASGDDVAQRRGAAIAWARLNPLDMPAAARKAIAEAVLDDDMENYFGGLSWDAFDGTHGDLLQAARPDAEEIATHLIVKIENGEIGADTITNLLELLFPRREDPPQGITASSLTPLQARAVRALVTALDRGERVMQYCLDSWGLPDTQRELRNLAARRPRTRIDESLPLVGDPDDPRIAIIPGNVKPGDRIHHRKFGLGAVAHVESRGRETLLTVQFEEEGEIHLGLPSDGSPRRPGGGGVWSWVARKMRQFRSGG